LWRCQASQVLGTMGAERIIKAQCPRIPLAGEKANEHNSTKLDER